MLHRLFMKKANFQIRKFSAMSEFTFLQDNSRINLQRLQFNSYWHQWQSGLFTFWNTRKDSRIWELLQEIAHKRRKSVPMRKICDKAASQTLNWESRITTGDPWMIPIKKNTHTTLFFPIHASKFRSFDFCLPVSLSPISIVWNGYIFCLFLQLEDNLACVIIVFAHARLLFISL